ncbi:hypothetical protein NECAME_04459 [Necator americanus]|uniref:Uncharacterized protein n=1 Tax=Necator americanus TaxID=51031 RepID=W2SUN9_NECAM|nr:hypothetical protein NECAME_04459 [Necator americanus]ETN72556.1 hypothetical protein NECAME_04459 [Necator americanus]
MYWYACPGSGKSNYGVKRGRRNHSVAGQKMFIIVQCQLPIFESYLDYSRTACTVTTTHEDSESQQPSYIRILNIPSVPMKQQRKLEGDRGEAEQSSHLQKINFDQFIRPIIDKKTTKLDESERATEKK